jgi:hypothetical protein
MPSKSAPRTSRPRVAPNALRTASSSARAEAAASCRFATFAQVSTSSSATPASSSEITGRASPTTSSPSHRTRAWNPAKSSADPACGPGYSLPTACTVAVRSRRASSSVTRGRSRPSTLYGPEYGFTLAGSTRIGSHTPMSRDGNVVDAFNTPTIVNGSPSRFTVVPMTFGSAANDERQSQSDRTTRRGPFGTSSSRVNARPSAG